MDQPILVYGWYNHDNIGDELFKQAFQTLFPKYRFIFTDFIDRQLLDQVSVVFIGGGSFLNECPSIQPECFDLLLSKKILYIGVGAETHIHEMHVRLMNSAKLIAFRTIDDFAKIQNVNSNVLYIPDLVFSLPPENNQKTDNSILIIPNASVIPMWFEDHWKHAAWNYFKMEFAQFLDYLIESGYYIDMLAMSHDRKNSDVNAGMEIINSMKHRSNYLLPKITSYKQLTNIISTHKMVISQRYHGNILSEICDTPYISIYHHDKLKTNYYNRGIFIPYYGIFKTELTNKFHDVRSSSLAQRPTDDPFISLKDRVRDIING
jgi:polysaccharide pyruvyl transferase WcaK-like protein